MNTAAFLERAGWSGAQAEPLAGDASARRYTRLRRGTDRAILMHDPDGDTGRFAALARYLRSLGLSAPEVLADAPEMLLLEDLGDGLLARLAADPTREIALYAMATDALIALHSHPAPDWLAIATPETLAQATDLAFTRYAGRPDLADPAAVALRPLLAEHAPPRGVCVLRDYHAENILHLPDRDGVAQAGLLDFQDAVVGHPAYDLASLITDARRDLRPGTAEACIARYCAASGVPRGPFEAALAVLGVQRNLRILGVFARLALERRKPGYLTLLPRVWAHLQAGLAHPALAPLRPALAALPAPTPATIARLTPACPTP
jgi:aminoglycoside/choline kinase family phosphotransferase